jgi:putative holliday junction resolvase
MSYSQRVLAIDFGLKRIGLALSDDRGVFAAPYAVRERTNIKRDIADLVETIRGLRVQSIVFGLPRAAEGDEVHHQTPLQNFAAKLEQALLRAGVPCEIVWWDERFSTAQAWRGLHDAGISTRRGKESVDAHAAAVILQGYLDAKHKTNHEFVEENPNEDAAWLK